MLSRNLYILAGTLVFFALLSYAVPLTGLTHEQGAPSDDSLWRTIGIVLLLIGLVVALLGVLQGMFEQAERRTPGGQDAINREYKRRRQQASYLAEAERRADAKRRSTDGERRGDGLQ